MTRAPRAARRTAGRLRMSPRTTSSWRRYRAAKGRLARAPLEKLSSTRTRAPFMRRRSTRCEPMNPAPPVTSARSCTRRLYHRRLGGHAWSVALHPGKRHARVGDVQMPPRASGFLSVIVPVLNEEDNIPELVRRLKAALDGGLPFDIIFVEDGRTHRTSRLATSLHADA